MKDKRLFRHPAMRILKKAIRREQRIQLILYVSLGLAGSFIVWRFFSSYTFLCIIGVFLAGIGFYFSMRLLRHWGIQYHPIIHVLEQNPDQVVWVYTVVTRRVPYGLEVTEYGHLYLKLLNGEDVCVGMPARHLRLVSHYLNRLLPHATFGYSSNKEQLYRINPEMLLQ